MRAYASAGDAVRDAERLARAMTFKAGAAGLRIGGGKGVIALPADGVVEPERRLAALHDFAELVESLGGLYVTAQDVGTSVDDIAYMGRFTRHVAGHPIAQGGCGDPSPFTAHGVEVAIRASLKGHALTRRHVVVIGLGHVGGALAERLAAAGARLTVTDAVEADVLAPCALGGILTDATVARLRVRVVAGAANNQLSEDRVAGELARRGILWAPDFVANAGGLIAVFHEHDRGGFDPKLIERAIEGIADTLREVYRRARASGTDTLDAAMALATERSALIERRAA
jgi:leucine dehydrogenase